MTHKFYRYIQLSTPLNHPYTTSTLICVTFLLVNSVFEVTFWEHVHCLYHFFFTPSAVSNLFQCRFHFLEPKESLASRSGEQGDDPLQRFHIISQKQLMLLYEPGCRLNTSFMIFFSINQVTHSWNIVMNVR